jgi:hypothetical protein
MTWKTCTQCGRLIPSGSRCALHPKRWRSGSTRQWRETRARILDRDGHRCMYVADGERCPATALLEVHHLVGGSVLNVPDHELVTVCRKHNPRGG